MQTIDSLNRRFGIPSALRFEPGTHNLVRAAITTPHADAHVYLHGANVTGFQPRGERPVLFLSDKSHFETGKPIRGGVPICYPWFGAHENDSRAPMHGTARLNEWTIESATAIADGSVALTLTWTNCRYRVRVGPTLTLSLEVRNETTAPYRFEAALHTYFAVGDSRQIRIEGLAGAEYLSKVENVSGQREGADPIRVARETDRVYFDTRTSCVIHDPVWHRRIINEKIGSHTTVVWNPWIDKSKALPDFGDDEWRNMVCIETCNVKRNAVTLPPGKAHVLEARIRVVPE